MYPLCYKYRLTFSLIFWILSKAVQDKPIETNLRGFAKIRWPMVTKLVSWFDINQASDETLQNNEHVNNWHHFKFDNKKHIFLVMK